MFIQYSTTDETDAAKAASILSKLIKEKGIKVHHLEKMLRTTTIKPIASGKMRPPRETFERIIKLGETYGIQT